MKHSTEILVELFKRGNYEDLPLFDKQHEALRYLEDKITTELLYGGSARAGKSVLASDWQIMRRLAYPGSKGFIGRAEYTKLADTTLKTFFARLSHYGLVKDVDYIVRGQHVTVTFANGSEVFFREIKYVSSDPEFDRLGSYDLTDAVLDEAQQIHWKAIQVLKGRFSVTKMNGWETIPKALYTCNPRRNWVYTDFVRPHKLGELPEKRKFVQALPSDNPHVPQSFFDNLKTADEVTKQRLLYGNFEYDDDDRALVTIDAVNDLFTNDHVPVGNDNKLSTDLAMQGRDRFVAGNWQGMRVKIVCDQPKSTGPDIEGELKRLKVIHKVSNSNIVADSDGLGAFLEGYVKNIVTFHGGSTKMAKEYKDTYKNLRSACAFKLAELINNREIYIVGASADQKERITTELTTCLKRHNVDDDGKLQVLPKDKMKEYMNGSPDYMDMLLMRMYWLVTKKRKVIT